MAQLTAELLAAAERVAGIVAMEEAAPPPLLADDPEGARAHWAPILAHDSVDDLDAAIRGVEAGFRRAAEEAEEAPLPSGDGYEVEAPDLIRAYNYALTQIDAELATAPSEWRRRALLARREHLTALCFQWCPEGSRPWDDGVEDLTTPVARTFIRELSHWSRTPRPHGSDSRLHQRIRVGIPRRRSHCGTPAIAARTSARSGFPRRPGRRLRRT